MPPELDVIPLLISSSCAGRGRGQAGPRRMCPGLSCGGSRSSRVKRGGRLWRTPGARSRRRTWRPAGRTPPANSARESNFRQAELCNDKQKYSCDSLTDLSELALKVEPKHSLLQVGHGREEEDVEEGAQEAGGDGEELRGGERRLVHLHPREQQQRHGGGDHEGAALVQCHDWYSLSFTIWSRFSP